MTTAPLYADISEAPDGGQARWIYASDGVRLRLALWNTGDKGTVLIFPGRTEFIEKYGRVVGRLQALGYGCAVIDWRGQGLSDRLVPNRQLGHVDDFQNYQRDVAAMLATMIDCPMPAPYYLCSHSMGGAIAYRSLRGVLPVKKAVFTSPMWGLQIDPMIRPIIQAVAAGSRTVGMGAEFAPGTGPENYVQTQGYDGNPLTSDPDTFAYMERQVAANPGLSIGGPSIMWLYEALTETRIISKSGPPCLPTLTLMGSDEQVVDSRDIVRRMENWPGGNLEIIKGARHEILMETPAIQDLAFAKIEKFFSD